MNDSISDMLTRIRNANRIGRTHVNVKRSKVCVGVAGVLKSEGFIRDYVEIPDETQGQIRIELKYGESGEKVIQKIDRVSKPGRRVYEPVERLPRVLDGLGIAVVSTSRGVVSDRRARAMKVGGEILCTVW